MICLDMNQMHLIYFLIKVNQLLALAVKTLMDIPARRAHHRSVGGSVHRSKAEGRGDGQDHARHHAAVSLSSSATPGTAVAGRFGPHRDRWALANLSNLLTAGQRSQEERIATPTVASAAVASLGIAVAAVATTASVTFAGAVAAAVGATFTASLTARAFTRFRQAQSPAPEEEQAAILRIQSIVSSLLERYGMEKPEINPPVKLIDTSGTPISNDIDGRLAAVKATSSEFFLSQLVDRPRLTVILGESGSGKTSLLLRLAQRMLLDRPDDRRGLIPLFFKCRDWSDEYDSFYKWVTANALKSYDVPLHISDYWIRSGRLFIALDGLHELPPNCFEEFSKEVSSWIRAAEGTRLAISSTMEPEIRELIRSLGADQLCAIQPLPTADIRRLLRRTLSRLSFREEVPAVRAMDGWMQDLISRNDQLRGPALVGLLAEAIGEAKQLPDNTELPVDSKDPADVTFLLANSFFSRGDFTSAQDAYRAITRLPRSRWQIPAYALLATCLYLLGNVDQASDAMLEAVTLRLHESVRATPEAVENLSEDEMQCLAVVPFDKSLDIVQISSASGLPLSRSREALWALRERGLVETAAYSDDRARFRRSATAAASR